LPEKIKVVESPSLLRKVLVVIIAVPILFFGIIAFLGWVVFPLSLSNIEVSLEVKLVRLALGAFIVGLGLFLAVLLYSRRPKIEVTSILFIDKNVEGYFNYALCNEGVVLYQAFGPRLYRWSKLKSYTEDRAARLFSLKISLRHTVVLMAIEKFEEVKLILSKNLPVPT
jgi:hypothetical protein